MRDTKAKDDVWAWATGSLWLALAVALLVTVSDYGMSWDEVTRWQSGDNKLDYYERLLGEEGMAVWGERAGSNLYPGLFDLPLSVYARYVGGDRRAAGHLYTIVFAVLAVAAAGMIAREIGGWRLAFWASLLLLILPRFYGHMVFNPKDIPFAATYSWGLWGVLRVARGFDASGFGRWPLAGLLAGLAMATRLPGMIILAYLAGLFIFYFVAQSLPSSDNEKKFPGARCLLVNLGGLVLAGSIAVVVLMVFFPASHANPFADSARVVDRLHDFSTAIPVLFRGQVYDAGSTPWYYALWMLFVTTPLWQLLLLAGGAIMVAWRFGVSFYRRQWWRLDIILIGTLLLGFGFPLLYILVSQPAIHNGVRHLLFILPAGAGLMAFALCSLYGWVTAKQPRIAAMVIMVVTFGVGWNLASLIRLHPYQYVYFNALVGGPAGALGQYETEYWFTSTPEAYALLQEWRDEQGLPQEPVKLLVTGPLEIAEHQLPSGWSLASRAEEADYFLGNTQFAGHLLVEGQTIVEIERMGLPILVIKALPRSKDDTSVEIINLAE